MALHRLSERILNLMSDGRRRSTKEVHTHLGLEMHRYASASTVLSRMRKQGLLESELVDGRRYYWLPTEDLSAMHGIGR